MKVSRIAKLVNYDCGCSAQYVVVGYNPGNGEWQVSPCYKHNAEKEALATNAEEDYLTTVRQLLTEHNAIAFLIEKGYSISDAITGVN